ncbi:hypothetical protein JCM19232_2436 [Vibrio ishigakensis]|uniref:Uncharacterized protein n=1 Tax=Vibrio ishigakensis TaxID=1481914 RepID=A0A0B8PAR6_9VIBR|nr:hypothetical protein JCM19232_2436 [Vibrio ishigakensis]
MPVALWVLLFVAIVPYLLAGLGGYMKIKHLGHLDNRHPRYKRNQRQVLQRVS